jgi:hypothetical protein
MNQITIELKQRDFTGGETIEGAVIVALDQPLPVRGVRVSFTGYEKSYWSTGSGKNRHTHSEQQYFFQDEFTLFGKPKLTLGELIGDSVQAIFSKDNYEQHPAGVHHYPFTYTLPTNLPGDYDSPMTHSEIKYLVNAEVDLPLKLDLCAAQEITVYERRDFADQQPVIVSGEKSFLFNSQAGLTMAVTLPKSKFFLGESTTCRVNIENRSDKREIKSLEIALEQTEQLVANARQTSRSMKVGAATFSDCVIPPNQPSSFELPYQIPSDLYADIRGGRLVTVSHELVATLEIPWAVDLVVKVPVELLEIAGSPGGVKG